MSNFYNSHTLEELDKMHPCQRHNMCGSLDLGPCGLCYGRGWVEEMFGNGFECPNQKQNEEAYQEWRRKHLENLDVQ